MDMCTTEFIDLTNGNKYLSVLFNDESNNEIIVIRYRLLECLLFSLLNK